MYFTLQKTGTVKLNWFNNQHVFKVAIGADGAPFGKDDEATAFLLLFLNLEGMVASCNDNHLIFGAYCGEGHPAAVRYCRKLVADIAHIESNTFSIAGHDNIKFVFNLIPADMKWLATYARETNNAFYYFSTFADVHESNKATLNASLGDDPICTWHHGSMKTEQKMLQRFLTSKPN